jgi:hypothetical protein
MHWFFESGKILWIPRKEERLALATTDPVQAAKAQAEIDFITLVSDRSLPYIQLCRLLRIHIERRKRPCEVQWNGMHTEPQGCPPGCGAPSERRTSCR